MVSESSFLLGRWLREVESWMEDLRVVDLGLFILGLDLNLIIQFDVWFEFEFYTLFMGFILIFIQLS